MERLKEDMLRDASCKLRRTLSKILVSKELLTLMRSEMESYVSVVGRLLSLYSFAYSFVHHYFYNRNDVVKQNGA